MELIAPDDTLFRRILAYFIRADGSISSAAFMTRSKRPDPSISVHLARLTTPEQSLAVAGVPGLGVVGLKTATPLDMGLSVRHDPLPGDEAHCVIKGVTSKQQCAELARACWLVLAPTARTGSS